MKNLIFSEVLKYLRSTPNLKKKLMVFVGIGVAGLMLATTFIVAIGVAGVKYVAGVGSNIDVAQHAEALRLKVDNIPVISSVECLGAAQGLMNLESLLLTPIKDNFLSLKRACFDGPLKVLDEKKEAELI